MQNKLQNFYIKYLCLPLNLKSIAIILAAVIAFSFLAVSVGLNRSPSLLINTLTSHYDVRLDGISEKGWSSPNFSVHEPRVSPQTTNIEIKFDLGSPNEPKPQFIFKINGNELTPQEIPASGAIVLSLKNMKETTAKSWDLPGLMVEGTSLNPRKSGEGYLGAKILSVQFTPQFLTTFPSFDFGLIPVLCVASLSLLLCLTLLSRTHNRICYLPVVIVPIICSMVLAANRLDYWKRSIWAWLFFALILGGILFFQFCKKKKLNLQENALPNSSLILICMLVITGLAFWIRFYGLDFGLPGFFHPDEGRKMKIARNMVVTGNLDPDYFRHPTFLLYATAFMSWLVKIFSGHIPDLPTVAYMGRSVSAGLGALSVPLLFLIGKRLFGNLTGVLSAALLAVAPLHVVCSRYIKEDSSLVFFTLLSFYFMLRALDDKGRFRFIVLTALTAGFSASSKYSGMLNIVFAFVPIFDQFLSLICSKYSWASILNRFRFNKDLPPTNLAQLVLKGFILLVVFVAGFVLVSPYTIFNNAKFVQDFMGEKVHMERGHTVAITALSYYWTYHFHFSVVPAFRGIVAYLAIFAVGFLFARSKPKDLLVIATIFLFYLPSEWVNAKPQPQPERYILPCIPFLCLALAALVVILKDNLKSGKSIFFVTVSLALLIQPLRYTLAHAKSITVDTRVQAGEWLSKNISPHSKVIIDWKFYAPPLVDTKYKVLELKDKAGNKLLRSFSPDSLKNSGYDYLVISSLFYGRYLDPLYRSHNLSQRFKAFLASEKPLASFEAEEFEYGFHNPTIYIFSLKNSS